MKLPEKIPNEVGTVWAENSIPYKLNQLIDYLAERGGCHHEMAKLLGEDWYCKKCMKPAEMETRSQPIKIQDSVEFMESFNKPTPLFKAEDIHTGQDYWGQEVLRGFPTKEAAEQAREALLKLSKN